MVSRELDLVKLFLVKSVCSCKPVEKHADRDEKRYRQLEKNIITFQGDNKHQENIITNVHAFRVFDFQAGLGQVYGAIVSLNLMTTEIAGFRLHYSGFNKRSCEEISFSPHAG